MYVILTGILYTSDFAFSKTDTLNLATLLFSALISSIPNSELESKGAKGKLVRSKFTLTSRISSSALFSKFISIFTTSPGETFEASNVTDFIVSAEAKFILLILFIVILPQIYLVLFLNQKYNHLFPQEYLLINSLLSPF